MMGPKVFTHLITWSEHTVKAIAVPVCRIISGTGEVTAGFGCPEDFGVLRTRGPPCPVAFGDVLISCFRSLFVDWGLLGLSSPSFLYLRYKILTAP